MQQTSSRQVTVAAGINISVIVPAHNAAETIAETLASLHAQTHEGWEAIVIDDGSSDETAATVQGIAAQDPRIRIVNQSRMGVSAARNRGISLARFDWLLFLDADDWLLPLYLEQMTRALTSDPDLDAVHCGWARVTPDGTRMEEKHGPPSADLFPTFTRLCAFAVHACVVRRSIVEAIGGFDISLRICEDWDLWQRIARAGARFGAIRDILALYRIRPSSASSDGARFLADGLRVITRGYSPDPRVQHPLPAYANGLSAAELASARLYFACWTAGIVLGCGDDAKPLLNLLADDHAPGLDPVRVAESIFESALLPTCCTPTAWVELWPRLQQRIHKFLLALEAQSMTPRLAHRAQVVLERMILAHSKGTLPLTVGTTYGVRVEITEPLPDICPPTPIERLHCAIELDGTSIGMLELPVCEGLVLSYVLADAIAAAFSWAILGCFFERTVYRDLTIKKEPTGLSLWRGTRCLARGIAEGDAPFWQQVHNRIGWTVFLQEIWGCPDWPLGWFYRGDRKLSSMQNSWRGFMRQIWGRSKQLRTRLSMLMMAPRRRVDDGWLVIDLSDNLPDVEVTGRQLDVLLTAGGVALGVVTLPIERNLIRAQELRTALTTASGLELCRAVVREGLLGRPMTDQPTSLRIRLAAAAAQDSINGSAPEVAADNRPAHEGWCVLSRAMSSGVRAMVLGRRAYGEIETSVSRRAMLPVAMAQELLESASVASEPVMHMPRPSESPERVVYMPDLIRRRLPPEQAFAIGTEKFGRVRAGDMIDHGRSHLETLFATPPDSWRYTNAYEQMKYAQTLKLLPDIQISRALELACAEGHFTVQLAPRVRRLISADISQIALSRAAERCAGLDNVSFQHFDLTKDPLTDRFELIVCSEVLYHCTDKEGLRAVACKLVDAVEPGGYLLTAHANLIADDPHHTGFDWDCPFGAKIIGEVLASIRPLRLVKELRTPLYRIQLFQRDARYRLPFLPNRPEVIELPPPAPLPPEVASHVLWYGSRLYPAGTTQAVVTDRLPILMYHRVAPTGSATMTRYRLSPEAFEEQLCYLRDAGYYSVSPEDWRTAMQAKKPLPGKAVLITFDDGYLDFLTHAWPLLQRYGFSATVFLVTSVIGKSNIWDRVYGDEVPLLGWQEIAQLQDEGVKFGSHSASHHPLTGLSPEEIVREGVESRLVLERELGVPIKAFAYPYGDTDQVVQHLIGACGYIFGLSCQNGLSRFEDSLLALPRIEVTCADRFQNFVAKLDSHPMGASD
jgi:peptidoglycan/xylan/chitin deacetylase (PgdA/CDA1 family)/GT2 family glycosyltransferase/2-polyprenyl-3-methyl-5-hydroxy-6-metoxy-1,4-benzoquinol methylase